MAISALAIALVEGTDLAESISTENQRRASTLRENFGMETLRFNLYRLAGDSKVFSLSVPKDISKHLY